MKLNVSPPECTAIWSGIIIIHKHWLAVWMGVGVRCAFAQDRFTWFAVAFYSADSHRLPQDVSAIFCATSILCCAVIYPGRAVLAH